MTVEMINSETRAWVICAMFLTFVAVTLFGAGLAVLARRLVHSVSGLALCFLGVAGLYYFLHSPFLALMQILIYVGAVCVTILFALMLADPGDAVRSLTRDYVIAAASFLAAALLGGALVYLALQSAWMPPQTQVNAGDVRDLGRALLGRFGFAFELISVVLLLAILGALMVARSGRRDKL